MRVDQSVIRPAPWNSALVLVVEPDAELRDEICLDLQQDGTEVLGLADGGGLLEYFQTAAYSLSVFPDVIVAGLERPEARVLEACEQLRQYGARVPVVLLSPDRDADLYEACEKTGATFVIDQPVDLGRLRTVVSGLTLGT